MQRVEIIINQGQNKQTESTKFQHLIIFDFARLTSSVFCNNFQKERFFLIKVFLFFHKNHDNRLKVGSTQK